MTYSNHTSHTSSCTAKMRAIVVCCLFITAFNWQASAQYYSQVPALLQPSGTQYFQNQYLANPAMAGIDTGLHLNAAHRRQWTGIDDAPVTTFITADMAIGGPSGMGLNIFSDKAGQLTRSRVALSYAYHLPLNTRGDQHLHFGLSLAINMQRVSLHHFNGDVSDPTLAAFNTREDYFEGEYGMAYTGKHWTIQAAIPNARALFSNKDDVSNGGTVLFGAAAYKFTPEGAVNSIEPKVCYRQIKNFDDIIDAGVNVAFLNGLLNLTGLYHSSKSFTAGAGVNINGAVVIQAMYTSQTEGIKTYVDGTYELGVKVNLFR